MSPIKHHPLCLRSIAPRDLCDAREMQVPVTWTSKVQPVSLVPPCLQGSHGSDERVSSWPLSTGRLENVTCLLQADRGTGYQGRTPSPAIWCQAGSGVLALFPVSPSLTEPFWPILSPFLDYTYPFTTIHLKYVLRRF
jgi:hypothetical protein